MANNESPCPACGATSGRCRNPDGELLPRGQIHRGRLKALEGIDCLECRRTSTTRHDSFPSMR